MTVPSTGSISFTVNVVTGTIGDGACGTSTSTSSCYLVVVDLNTVGNPTPTSVTLKIAFAAAKASPTKGLTNGAAVAISGVGWKLGDTVAAVECNKTLPTEPTPGAACNTTPLGTTTVAKGGKIAFTVHVTTGTVGDGACGNASSTSSCYLVVVDTATETSATPSAALIKIGFVFAAGKPTTKLVNGTAVSVTGGGGWVATNSVAVVECNANLLTDPTPANACDSAPGATQTVASNGTFPATSFAAHTGTVGDGTCGTTTTDTHCFLVVVNLTQYTGGNPTPQSAVIPITFT
jgi:hypothetical protein